jgi:hypothetical protein
MVGEIIPESVGDIARNQQIALGATGKSGWDEDPPDAQHLPPPRQAKTPSSRSPASAPRSTAADAQYP